MRRVNWRLGRRAEGSRTDEIEILEHSARLKWGQCRPNHLRLGRVEHYLGELLGPAFEADNVLLTL